MQVLISYIITLYNKKNDLPDLLKSLRDQKGLDGATVEYIFADDLSTDGSVEYLLSEARLDSRIKLIRNSKNVGPSLRLNQAARMATGQYFIPLDADDYLPANATLKFLDAVRETGAPLIFGASQRGVFPPRDITDDAHVTIAQDALAYCAKKKIVRMGFMAERALWELAGGADERLFIQDQSLPLRLSANAKRLAYIHDVVYWLRPVGKDNLSCNKLQQHHDRFFAALYQLQQGTYSQEAERALCEQIVSARWKAARDSRKLPFFSRQFLRYLTGKLIAPKLNATQMEKYAEQMAEIIPVRKGLGAGL